MSPSAVLEKMNTINSVDFSSELFDSIKALSAKSIDLPFPKSKTYNNLAEYYSHTFGKKSSPVITGDKLFLLERNYAWYYETLGLEYSESEEIDRFFTKKHKSVYGGLSKKSKKQTAYFTTSSPLKSTKIIFSNYRGVKRNLIISDTESYKNTSNNDNFSKNVSTCIESFKEPIVDIEAVSNVAAAYSVDKSKTNYKTAVENHQLIKNMLLKVQNKFKSKISDGIHKTTSCIKNVTTDSTRKMDNEVIPIQAESVPLKTIVKTCSKSGSEVYDCYNKFEFKISDGIHKTSNSIKNITTDSFRKMDNEGIRIQDQSVPSKTTVNTCSKSGSVVYDCSNKPRFHVRKVLSEQPTASFECMNIKNTSGFKEKRENQYNRSICDKLSQNEVKHTANVDVCTLAKKDFCVTTRNCRSKQMLKFNSENISPKNNNSVRKSSGKLAELCPSPNLEISENVSPMSTRANNNNNDQNQPIMVKIDKQMVKIRSSGAKETNAVLSNSGYIISDRNKLRGYKIPLKRKILSEIGNTRKFQRVLI